MSLYNDKKDYETLVRENIERANILYSLSEKDRILVNNLLDKKEKIKKRMGHYLIKYENITELNFKLLCFIVPSVVVNKSSSNNSYLHFIMFS